MSCVGRVAGDEDRAAVAALGERDAVAPVLIGDREHEERSGARLHASHYG